MKDIYQFIYGSIQLNNFGEKLLFERFCSHMVVNSYTDQDQDKINSYTGVYSSIILEKSFFLSDFVPTWLYIKNS